MKRAFFPLFLILIGGLLLSGCVIRSADFGSQKEPYFRPAPPIPAGTPAATQASSEQITPVTQGEEATPGATQVDTGQPSPTVDCKDNLVFVKDITIPDGTEVTPESTLDKRWEVENNGNCNWGEGYRVRLIAGPELGAQKEQALTPARSGTRAIIRVQFKAPADPAIYRSAWQAFNAKGEAFGDPFFIEIKVKKP